MYQFCVLFQKKQQFYQSYLVIVIITVEACCSLCLRIVSHLRFSSPSRGLIRNLFFTSRTVIIRLPNQIYLTNSTSFLSFCVPEHVTSSSMGRFMPHTNTFTCHKRSHTTLVLKTCIMIFILENNYKRKSRTYPEQLTKYRLAHW